MSDADVVGAWRREFDLHPLHDFGAARCSDPYRVCSVHTIVGFGKAGFGIEAVYIRRV